MEKLHGRSAKTVFESNVNSRSSSWSTGFIYSQGGGLCVSKFFFFFTTRPIDVTGEGALLQKYFSSNRAGSTAG